MKASLCVFLLCIETAVRKPQKRRSQVLHHPLQQFERCYQSSGGKGLHNRAAYKFWRQMVHGLRLNAPLRFVIRLMIGPVDPRGAIPRYPIDPVQVDSISRRYSSVVALPTRNLRFPLTDEAVSAQDLSAVALRRIAPFFILFSMLNWTAQSQRRSPNAETILLAQFCWILDCSAGAQAHSPGIAVSRPG